MTGWAAPLLPEALLPPSLRMSIRMFSLQKSLLPFLNSVEVISVDFCIFRSRTAWHTGVSGTYGARTMQ